MKNILLVTIQDYNNIGNRLQNYALQFTLERLGCKVDNLIIQKIDEVSIVNKIKYLVKKTLALCGQKKYKKDIAALKRKKKCILFTKRYISNLEYREREQLSSCDWDRYDMAVTGSDQVWHNWGRIVDELSYFYLDFISSEKRHSYAPSFGFPDFPQVDREQHQRGLLGMRSLSCREQEGCDLIRRLTGREAVKVLDPTLLLKSEDWVKLENRPDFIVGEKYLLKFILGIVSEEYQSEINRIAEKRNLIVLDINNYQDSTHYAISPSEFIWLIHHADTVCTDSFHCSVFSILFEKDLRIFNRNSPEHGNMFGRLHDLLKPLDLMENVYGFGENTSTVLNENAKNYLEKERQNSIAYLRGIMNGV